MCDTQKMLDEHVKAIAKTLEKIKDSYFYWDVDTEEPDDDSEANYFDDIYGLTCYLDMFDKSVDGYRIMVACGGPNIFVDTKEMEVQGFWGFQESHFPFSYNTAKAIDRLFADWYSID